MAYGAIIGQTNDGGIYETLDRDNMIRIPAGADVNNYTTPGVYFIAFDDKNSVLNLPEFLYTGGYVSAFIVREGLYTGSQIIQEIYVADSGSPARYVKKIIRGRGTTSAGWCDWIEFYSTYNKPTAADVGAITQEQADARYLQRSGGTITGPVTMNNVFKVYDGYIDAVQITSSEGNLILGASSVVTLAPTAKTISVSNSRITNVATPTSNNDAANKSYVDQQIVAAGGGIVTGTYTGNGSTTGQTINLGFRPKAVIWGPASGISGMSGSSWGIEYYFVIDGITIGEPGSSYKDGAQIVSNGFMVYGRNDETPNNDGTKYMYIAFK